MRHFSSLRIFWFAGWLLARKLPAGALLIGVLLTGGADAQDLASSFRHPPAGARPWVFWYWMQAAVTREGIRADLLSMKEAGIGGAYLMPIKGVANPPLIDPPVEQLSPAWWDMVRFAMHQADSLGLQLAMHACDGFAVAGGPWITPELSMQKLTWARWGLEGGRKVDVTAPLPPSNEGYYRDVAVLAFPTPASWEVSTRTIIPRVTTSMGTDAAYLVKEGNKGSFRSDGTCWIQYAFDRPFTCRSIVIRTSGNNYQAQRLAMEVSDDGINFRSIGRMTPPRHGWQDGDADVTHAIAPVTARYFRFLYDKAGSEPGSEDLDAAKWKPSLKISGLELSAMPVIDGYEGKNGEVWRLSARTTSRQVPDSLCVAADRIVDISSRMDSTGHLVWQAPAGHWTILRIGHTSTGHTNATGGAAKGLECDKFNPRAIELQFDRWFGETIRQVGPELAGRVLKVFHVDSWECGSQNWTADFRAQFSRHCGYDLLTWLPVMTGVPVGTVDRSERFLYDVRSTITELTEDKFYKTMERLAHAKGCRFSAESVAPTMTGDGMLHYQSSDIPMGEFWLRSPTHDKPNDMLDAISGAHVYGKQVVQAEGFTELRMAWDEHPGMMKTLQDRNYALGINRLVFHVFTENPWMDRRPGMTLDGVGTFLQRDQTWWRQGRFWIDYTQRCQWLLQQGRPVADIAVFTGEEIPRRAVLPDRLVSTLPGLFGAERVAAEARRLANTGEPLRTMPVGVVHSANMADPENWVDPLHGYAYDCINPDALLHLATVRDGRVVLPGGASYAVLVWPAAHPMAPDPGLMSAAVARRLLQLVQDGATLIMDGPKAGGYHTPGLLHATANDSIVRTIVRSLLSGRVGKGRVIRGPFTQSAIEGLPRDFIAAEGAAVATGIAYTHRVAPGMDIYFVSNQLDRDRRLTVSLRIKGRQPELWDAVTGEIRPADHWGYRNGHTEVDLSLPANGSMFIVLRRLTAVTATDGTTTIPHPFLTLNGPWTVHFDPSLGGPVTPVQFDSLTEWNRNADSSIAYYSGTAVYSKSFNWVSTSEKERIWLDLGQVANIARVFVNGVDCGVIWTFPYRIDITRALRPGGNELRIEVTNTWANRLIGDHSRPEKQRITWTTAPYHLDGRLLPAGLLGPVRLVTMARPSDTKLVLLGTGTPNADPDKMGPSLAIVVKGASYIVDCGTGVVRRAAAAARQNMPALDPAHLTTLFITHLHSDHTIGYPDMILTPAVLERKGPLEVYGPKGTAAMTSHILQAYKEDIDIRTRGLEHGNPDAYKVNVHEIQPGLIYKDSNVTVRAFPVRHGSWPAAYGFRFETPDKIIVVSGDCTYSEELMAAAKGCDILVHEVYSEKGFATRTAAWQKYHSAFHTSSKQLADIANKARPGLLVLTHELLWGATPEDLLKEITESYKGKVVFGNDLDVY